MPIYSACPPSRHRPPAGICILLARVAGQLHLRGANTSGHRLLPEIARRKIAGHHSIGGWWPGYGGRVLDTGWTEIVALAAAYLIAVVTTPAGIFGAVLLLP